MTLEDEDIPETGAVFTFGKSRFADNTPNKFWIRNDKVVHVSCGDDHSAFVTENGRLYTFGANEWGQLGLGSSKSTTKPSSVKALKQEGVKSVSCGRLHTIALSKAGKLYTFGAGGEGQLGLGDSDGSEVPKQVQSLDCYTVIQMSCGTDHSFILTDAGVLQAWGGGAEGQLGMDDTMESNIPRELPFRSKVKQVSCGYYHTAFVTEEGNLFTFGENDLGKLGLGDNFTGSTNIPTHVADIETPVHCVACGNNHTAAIAGDKDVYTFGEGSQGQLGLGPSLLQVSTPHLVTKLKKHRCKMISCGESHTAVVTESASLYTFGDGRHGKLAQGEESFSNLFVPTRVKRFKGFYVEQVSCGGCHTLVRARRKHSSQGEVSSDSETEIEEQVLRHSGNFEADAGSKELGENLKKLADSIDLQGSLNGSLGGTARGRRRQRETSPLPPLARTLPPLSTSTPKSLPALGARTMGDNSLSPQKIPNIPADFPDSNQNSTIKKEEDVTKAQESDDDDDDEDDDEDDDDEDDDDSDTDEDDDDDANAKRTGQDEVDAGTPVDEPLSQTYFSKSGNRSDMKPVASMKHKSKKKEESGDSPTTKVEVFEDGQTNGYKKDSSCNIVKDSKRSDGDISDTKKTQEAVTDPNTTSSSKGSSKKTIEDTQKNPAKEVKANTTKAETAKVKGNDKEAKGDEDEDDDDDDDDDEEEDDDDEDDDDEDEEEDGEEGSEEEEEGKGDGKKNRDKDEATSSKIQKEPEKDNETGEKKEETQEKGGGDQGKDVEKEKKTEKETVTEERKPWQFWKKKELPAKTVNEVQSDTKTNTQTQQGNVNRSKTCIIL